GHPASGRSVEGRAAATEDLAGRSSKTSANRRAGGHNFLSRYVLIGVWILVIIGFGIWQPTTFLTLDNFEVMFSSQAPLVLLALSLVPTLIAGELDLSIAGSMTLGATLMGQLNGVE